VTEHHQATTAGMRRLAVLIVSGDVAERDRVVTGLRRHCGLVEKAGTVKRAEEIFARCRFDCVVIDSKIAGADSNQWVMGLRSRNRALPIICLSEQADTQEVIGAMRAGVSDLLQRPLKTAALMASIRRLCAPAGPMARKLALVEIDGPLAGDDGLIGDSAVMRELKLMIGRIAPLPATVLVQGETGTGKELVARLLHQNSHRSGPFVPVNCGAIAPELLESELFGHIKGAFTSAHHLREGLFVSAHGGTLFLDEISEMPLELQVKLLRALEESKIRPVGSDRETSVDVRIVASTQSDLAALVRERRFREDLYYRLNVIHLSLPPLIERKEDIRELTAYFMTKTAAELGLPVVRLEEAHFKNLEQHTWPGNVRELRNVVERTLMMGEFASQPGSLAGSTGSVESESAYPLGWTLEQVKRAHMNRVLEACGNNKSAAARALGVSRKTLERNLGREGTRA
jgi:DNA-binding NtrC family response regulator